MVAFFYFRARRRDIAIARTLGVPAGVCMRQGAHLSHRPTLELLQSGAQAKQKEEKTAAQAAFDIGRGMPGGETAGMFAAAPIQPLPAAAASKHTLGFAHTFRFVGCYIRHSKAKSLLVLLLAALFTVGLATIRASILNSTVKVDELYQTVSVNLGAV